MPSKYSGASITAGGNAAVVTTMPLMPISAFDRIELVQLASSMVVISATDDARSNTVADQGFADVTKEFVDAQFNEGLRATPPARRKKCDDVRPGPREAARPELSCKRGDGIPARFGGRLFERGRERSFDRIELGTTASVRARMAPGDCLRIGSGDVKSRGYVRSRRTRDGVRPRRLRDNSRRFCIGARFQFPLGSQKKSDPGRSRPRRQRP